MIKNDIIGVILAAGKGSRMYPLSDKNSKCTLPICNKPLLDYQIEMMKEAGITEIIIVVGHNGFEVVRVIGNGRRQGVNITYVNQEERLGIAHAVGGLEPVINQPFLLLLGDIYFDCSSLKPMLKEFSKKDVNAVLATKIETDREAIKRNFTVMLNDDGSVRRVIEKPRHIVNDIKGCGLYLFDLHIFDAIRRTPRTAMRDEYEITDSIQILIDDGFKVKTADIINEDLNLTFITDLLSLNLIGMKKMNKDVIIGKNTSIKDVSLCKNVVIGDNVSILNDIQIKNTVIFPDSIVDETENISDSIIVNNQIIHCSKKTYDSWRG